MQLTDFYIMSLFIQRAKKDKGEKTLKNSLIFEINNTSNNGGKYIQILSHFKYLHS